MSNPPSTPENAAPATPVSPSRAAGTHGVATAATRSKPDHDAPPPALAGPQEALVPPPAPGQHGAPPFSPISPQISPSTPSTSSSTSTSVANHADQIKYPRGPAVLQRPHGPSLLTQALATARGIPLLPSQAELSHTKSQSASPYQDQSISPSRHEAPSQREHLSLEADSDRIEHDTLDQSDGDSLTPRGPPRASQMASSATLTTTAVEPSDPNDMPTATSYNMLDLREVNSMLRGHREYLSKTKGRGTSLERTDKEDRPNRSSTFSHNSESNSALVSPNLADSAVDLPGENAHQDAAPENAPQSRPWKAEHRVSMGPEKAWSIGTGEMSNGQDGQVEQSISEVLAGVEPNVRSRKASHSLRFFKEGLPADQLKRRDSRLAPHPREKLSPTGETPGEDATPGDGDLATPQVSDDKSFTPNRLGRTRSIPTHVPGTLLISESPEDYFFKHGKSPPRDATFEQLLSGLEPSAPEQRTPEAGKAPSGPGPEPGRKADDSTRPSSCAEDGDESGEEKISSAVFLPHQGPEQGQELPSIPGVPQRSVPGSRTLSRTDDFHPWLVKAGEPEVDAAEENRERKLRSDTVDSPKIAPEVDYNRLDDSAVADESETGAYPPKLSRPVSQYREDNIHEHQWGPKQPLEAIELIPYKHQVGGHTTLWRFSKRAVCKQLNNRENEFYERVEKYHRDLLAFLPRYIGVLNVTFQKQPRRKSTLKREDAAALERSQIDQSESSTSTQCNGNAREESPQKPLRLQAPNSHVRVISQSLQPTTQGPVPTVTFVDNQHILPRNLLQPTPNGLGYVGRYRSSSASVQHQHMNGHVEAATTNGQQEALRPTLEDRHANSWGATTVNKKLRNEVFNDAFLKQPIAIHRHRKGHHRPGPRRTLQQVLRPASSDPNLIDSRKKQACSLESAYEQTQGQNGTRPLQTQSDLGHSGSCCEDSDPGPKDVTGTSAPEPEIMGDSSPAQKRKRRYSGTGLRRKPADVRDPSRGDLKYFEEADDAGYKGDHEDVPTPPAHEAKAVHHNGVISHREDLSTIPSAATSGPPSPTAEFKKIPRPVNPKEAQTQRDSRVEYFLLLEDLTAGMKRPCIMDLKMGTRQYGVDANPKKQKSQQGKCAKTTSRELGVRVCGLQVWDVETQSYVFKDKYYGRGLKSGQEFQEALTRFLYDGVDPSSILRHIPTVLQKLGQLEVIIARLRGYRFYAASLLMFYDGDASDDSYDTAIEDSTTDFATDTEDAPRRGRKNPREIDFKIADFANCVTAAELSKNRPCPPKHPNEPDRGFLRGLRSLRKYFLKIQRDTRAEMGLVCQLRNVNGTHHDELRDLDRMEDEGSVSE
ncbi:inositol hexakisphosphate kinase 1 [Diplogelasinospora grovesii]|uniref:Kinase n=1 Tax=Diplogelasinospora grovesii TaxID=303347 RepID=A0AAN6NEV8_9PEZI|nr:inositol hexakisphosphate kinase 1 [Diplogelasinospora grovesii]